GLEKYITNLEDLCKKHPNYEKISMSEISRHATSILKTLKCIQVIAGPKNVHDIIDSLKSNH
ncbi:MAG: thiamine biosynthesis protein, partial [Nitrosotalea sp.]